MTTTTDHPIQSTGASQCGKILACLQAIPGQWYPMPALAEASGSYAVATRVSELRKQGHTIEQKNEREGGKIHSREAALAATTGSASGLELKPTRYVLGFLFRDNCMSCVFIRKEKPRWQAGLLNGVGGKIEPGETELEAMVREFREETGVDTSKSGWRQFCEMSGEGFVVYCFTARDSDAWEKAHTTESEKIETYHPDNIKELDCVSNLYWLVELALDENYGKEFYAVVRYSRPWRMPNSESSDAKRSER